jgi:signal transduction histidine kinase
MWSRISLKTRITVLLALLVLITVCGGLILMWYTYRMETLLTDITEKNLAGFHSAVALETALVNQKGFISYYYLDGDPDWLRQLGEYRQIFRDRLETARRLAQDEEQIEAVGLIETAYDRYIRLKDRVIAHYMEGERQTGADLHRKSRDVFFEMLALCEAYSGQHGQNILQARQKSRTEAEQLRIVALAAIMVDSLLAFFLAFVLVHHILSPVRQLITETERENSPAADQKLQEDEISILSRSVRGLIENFDHTHSELRKSRENLLQAEKMALVGKLAAGMAHSIRNPFTSVKMRLFSLGRSLELTAAQKEDFDVISSEIRHIDTIVQNFLEFSRPPKLQMQPISPSTVVDSAIQLLAHRMASYDVKTILDRSFPLPEVTADPEQLKEVLVNIVVNACEAMGKGGSIHIFEDLVEDDARGRAVRIRIQDNGPGIPATIIDKVLQPFFTTKAEGTGLGLSIAARIMEEHGGRLDVITAAGQGTTFILLLPLSLQ